MEEESYINNEGDEVFNQDCYEEFEDNPKARELGGFIEKEDREQKPENLWIDEQNRLRERTLKGGICMKDYNPKSKLKEGDVKDE